jgi:hypothetical protein
MGSSKIYLKSRPAGNSILSVDLLKYTPEAVELRLLGILRVNLYQAALRIQYKWETFAFTSSFLKGNKSILIIIGKSFMNVSFTTQRIFR